MSKALRAVGDFAGGYISTDGLIGLLLSGIPTDAATAVTSGVTAANQYQFVIEMTKIIGGIVAPIIVRWIDSKVKARRSRKKPKTD